MRAAILTLSALSCLFPLGNTEAAQLCPNSPSGQSSEGYHVPDSEFTAAKGIAAANRLEKYVNRMADCKSDCYDFSAVMDAFIARGAILRLKALAAAPKDKAAALKEYCKFLARAIVVE